MSDVTVILSLYKRPYTFEQQYDAICRQTHNCDILIWANKADNAIPDNILHKHETIYSNINFGVWGRFAIALNAKTKYICIIDDDTIPGSQWIENCINTIQNHNGVMTTRGVIAEYGKDHRYPAPESYKAFGWCNPNETVIEVDMGCHCWFFDKSLLHTFWQYAPTHFPMNFGEDMHLSFVAQKIGMKTYIPPHPKNNTEMWGSSADTGHSFGSDANAISWNPNANAGMNKYWNFLRKNGFKILAEI